LRKLRVTFLKHGPPKNPVTEEFLGPPFVFAGTLFFFLSTPSCLFRLLFATFCTIVFPHSDGRFPELSQRMIPSSPPFFPPSTPQLRSMRSPRFFFLVVSPSARSFLRHTEPSPPGDKSTLLFRTPVFSLLPFRVRHVSPACHNFPGLAHLLCCLNCLTPRLDLFMLPLSDPRFFPSYVLPARPNFFFWSPVLPKMTIRTACGPLLAAAPRIPDQIGGLRTFFFEKF